MILLSWAHQTRAQCSKDLGTLKAEKQAGPSMVIEFLGIIIDTSQQELRLPADKLERLQLLTMEWKLKIHKQLQAKKRPSCIREKLESLLGIMNHACSVILAGTFVHQIISLVHSVKQPYHHVRLNKDFLFDLIWWNIFARHWNGAALILGSRHPDNRCFRIMGLRSLVQDSVAPGAMECKVARSSKSLYLYR